MGILGRAPAVDKKVWCFFVVKLQRWNFARGAVLGFPPRAKFCKYHLRGYPFEANLYQKLPFLAIFWAVRPHLLSQNGKIWREGANPEDPPHAKFCKKSVEGISLFGKIIPKISNFGYFDTCKPTFLKPQPWSLAWGYEPGTHSPCLIL